jgi:hypothetical protein
MAFHAAFPDRAIIRRILANDAPPTAKRVFGHVSSFFGIADGKIYRYRFFAHFGFDTLIALDTTPAGGHVWTAGQQPARGGCASRACSGWWTGACSASRWPPSWPPAAR